MDGRAARGWSVWSGHVGRRRGVLLVAALVLVATLVAPLTASAAPAALPSTERSSPAVTGLEPGRIDVFWRTSSGRLAHRYRPVGGSWTRQLDLGGALASQPAAVSWAPGRLDVFARLSERRSQSRMSRIVGTPEYQRMTIRSWTTTTKLLALLDQQAGH